MNTHPVSPLRPWLRLATVLAALAVPASAWSQGLPLSNIRVSNNPDGWGDPQGPFNPNADIQIFVDFPTANHGGFSFSGVCVVALAATGQELGRVAIPQTWMQPGWDRLRSPTFRMSWPQAAVTVTCVPDYNPSQAMAVTLQPSLYASGAAGGAAPMGTPTPAPDGAPACRQRVLDRGWDPSNLSYCDGVNANCALTLLDRGWSPDGLPGCRGVQEDCAVELLNRGWDPTGLSNCVGADATCARELLDRGWDPSGLTYCQNVDPQCAVGVLQAGYDPSNLSSCAR
jgi:hypothetical protein